MAAFYERIAFGCALLVSAELLILYLTASQGVFSERFVVGVVNLLTVGTVYFITVWSRLKVDLIDYATGRQAVLFSTRQTAGLATLRALTLCFIGIITVVNLFALVWAHWPQS